MLLLIELWGMTEIAGLGSTHPLNRANKHASIGCTMPYCELQIADAEDASITMPRGDVVLKDGAKGDPDAIIAFCRESLSANICPRAIQFIGDLPKTGTGKIMRRELHTLDNS